MKVVGSIHQGMAEQKIAEYNSRRLEEAANQVKLQSEENVKRLRMQGKMEIEGARAAYAASGVSADGSALDVLAMSARNLEIDAQTIKRQGMMKAYALRSDAQLERMRGENAMTGAYIGAAASGLSGAGYMAAGFDGMGD